MKCDVANCTCFSTPHDDRFLWKCATCKLRFHAACVGVQRKCEEELLLYMTPMCKRCSVNLLDQQELSLGFQKLAQSAKDIEIAVNGLQEKKDEIDKTLEDIKMTGVNTKKQVDELSKNTCAMNDAFAKKLDSFCEEYKTDFTKFQTGCISTLHKEIKLVLDSIASALTEISKRQQPSESRVSNDLAQQIKDMYDMMLAGHHTISDDVTTNNNNPAPAPSLADELQSALKQTGTTTTNHDVTAPVSSGDGWRHFGNKYVWKPHHGWADYDRRMEFRAQQVKKADKAKRRRQRRRRHSGRIKDVGNNKIDNGSSSRSATRNSVENHNNIPYDSCNNSPINNSKTSNRASSDHLPSDKELLAAAKVTFAGVSTHPPKSRFVAFQKGETLNASQSAMDRNNSNHQIYTSAAQNNCHSAVTPMFNTPAVTTFAATPTMNHHHPIHTSAIPSSIATTCRTHTPAPVLRTQVPFNTPHQSTGCDSCCACIMCRQLTGPNFYLY